MLKLFGAMLVIIPFGFIGLSLGKNLTKHVQELRQFQLGLTVLETEIMYAQTPLPQALVVVAKQSQGVVSRFFTLVSEGLNKRQGQTAGEVWSRVLIDLTPYFMLNPEELNLLGQFGQGLGSSDREDQLKRLTSIKTQLAFREKTAEAARKEFQKIWQTLGWACGLMITLLFI